MSRAEDCLDAAHLHVGVCHRAGYANGRADVIEEIEALADEWERLWNKAREAGSNTYLPKNAAAAQLRAALNGANA